MESMQLRAGTARRCQCAASGSPVYAPLAVECERPSDRAGLVEADVSCSL
jgi:hypothetical protein